MCSPIAFNSSGDHIHTAADRMNVLNGHVNPIPVTH